MVASVRACFPCLAAGCRASRWQLGGGAIPDFTLPATLPRLRVDPQVDFRASLPGDGSA